MRRDEARALVRRAKNLSGALMDYVRQNARSGGVHLDRYDADFIVAIQMEWLQANNAVLTPQGVKRLREADSRHNRGRRT